MQRLLRLARPSSTSVRPRRRPVLRLRVERLENRSCPSGFTVVATGLDSPRGFAFGPDDQLYVAEGGPPTNTLSTTLDPTVQQVPAPVGPYTGGYNSSIVRINLSTGGVVPVVTRLPSSQTSKASGSLVSGVADVAFLGGTLYGIEAGAGPSHGLAGTANTVFRVNPDGTTTNVADLSAFQKANPVANPNPADFEPDGTWYSMVAVRGALYAVEPNHGELDRITPAGHVSRVIDVSATQGHVVPTAVAYHGNFYVGNLGVFGPAHQPESIYKVTPSGQIGAVVTGLSEVLGVDFDSRGRMYVLESSTGGVAPIPGTGVVARVNDDGSLTTLADGLTFPTAMRFGPDGSLYVSNFGFGIPGAGQIVRIDLPPADPSAATVAAGVLAAGPAPAPAAPEIVTPVGRPATTWDTMAGPYEATVTLGGLVAEAAPSAPDLVTPVGHRAPTQEAAAGLSAAQVTPTPPARVAAALPVARPRRSSESWWTT